MQRYRYRTSVLVGPWRGTPEKAAADAVNSNQARRGGDDQELIWLVPGRIEVSGRGEEKRP